MHVKKDVHNNLHDFEILECKYLKIAKAYYFYMTIEAIEEGNLGVYETKVVCNNDGRRTLSKFLLTNRTPAGTKAMAISFFSCVRSICKSLDGIVTPKVDRMHAIHRYLTGPNAAIAEATRLLMLKDATLRGLRQVISLGLPLLFPQECIRTTNPDGWSNPDDNFSQMVRRAKGTPCRGYDYDNPTLHWQVFQSH
uniref:uncharacterized protein LOC122591214 n=1 Tax=Erigeron canadensis TaxID=72917 RepID=UPI001CB997CC|nr:uncharacterized protein LOC122591214 [Erigeron canadensis]